MNTETANERLKYKKLLYDLAQGICPPDSTYTYRNYEPTVTWRIYFPTIVTVLRKDDKCYTETTDVTNPFYKWKRIYDNAWAVAHECSENELAAMAANSFSSDKCS